MTDSLTRISFNIALDKCCRRLAREVCCDKCQHPHLAFPPKDCWCGCRSRVSLFDKEQREPAADPTS